MSKGTLYLIPNTLGGDHTNMSLTDMIPDSVSEITASLDCFIAENAKSARAHLKRIAEISPLKLPLQQIDIAELNIRTDKAWKKRRPDIGSGCSRCRRSGCRSGASRA
mgnify:CR=1 FL=1